MSIKIPYRSRGQNDWRQLSLSSEDIYSGSIKDTEAQLCYFLLSDLNTSGFEQLSLGERVSFIVNNIEFQEGYFQDVVSRVHECMNMRELIAGNFDCLQEGSPRRGWRKIFSFFS
ncbi:MAG: hypothetical protein HLX50_23765 [Alteromonadaceae bacterium]|nr:hypothetical protein [Alteromonadaceae bacterium]